MSDRPYRIISVQQDTLTIDENGVPIIVSFDQVTLAPSDSANAGKVEERNAIKGEEVIIENG